MLHLSLTMDLTSVAHPAPLQVDLGETPTIDRLRDAGPKNELLSCAFVLMNPLMGTCPENSHRSEEGRPTLDKPVMGTHPSSCWAERQSQAQELAWEAPSIVIFQCRVP